VDEAGARALLERVSAAPAPPSGVDIGLARQRGRRRLRRRRWATALAPVLAATAVAAIIVGTGALGAPGTRRGTGPVTPVFSLPHRFNPLVRYAAFGWLPPGVPLVTAVSQSLPTEQIALAGSLRTGQYQLTIWAPGTCNRSAAQIRAALRRHHHPQLNCRQDPWSGSLAQVLRLAPQVRGKPGFWLRGRMLAWEYAPRSWATLQAYRRGTAVPAATLIKAAAAVRYGGHVAPAPRFPYQLTGVPASWRVTSVHWNGTSPLGKQLSAGPIGQLLVTPGTGKCWFDPGASHHVTLNGAKAVLTVFRQQGARPYQGLCVPETDGLSVFFLLFRAAGEHGYPFGGAGGLFLHHLHLLGPDPANWTTRPLG
jgi:hypothetical protein